MRKIIIFIVETSQYMTGCKMEIVNDTLKECIATLKRTAKANIGDLEFYIAVVTFSTTAEWQYNRFVPIEEYKWHNVSSGGYKNIGQAYSKVHQVLTMIEQKLGSDVSTPLIILVTDRNEPTDYYQPALDALKKEYWFEQALKLAVVIQNNFLEDFTNRKEAIITDCNRLSRIIWLLSEPEAPQFDLKEETMDNPTMDSIMDDLIKEAPTTDAPIMIVLQPNEKQDLESIETLNYNIDDWD